MGFGGVGSINIVLKNNRNLLSNPKREKFKSSTGSYGKIMVNDFPKASPQLLRNIRKRMIIENEQRQRKRNFVFVFSIIALITIMTVFLS